MSISIKDFIQEISFKFFVDIKGTCSETTLSNDNFSFAKKTAVNEIESELLQDMPTDEIKASDVSTIDKLQSPDESHFSITPVKSSHSGYSPSNCFTSSDCNEILQEELDNLEINSQIKCETQACQNMCETETSQKKGRTVLTADELLSPLDENISMFSIVDKSECKEDNVQINEEIDIDKSDGQIVNKEQVLDNFCFNIDCLYYDQRFLLYFVDIFII